MQLCLARAKHLPVRFHLARPVHRRLAEALGLHVGLAIAKDVRERAHLQVLPKKTFNLELARGHLPVEAFGISNRLRIPAAGSCKGVSSSVIASNAAACIELGGEVGEKAFALGGAPNVVRKARDGFVES